MIMSLVAIVGRPNVGKSTLFNRLVGMRQAIVDETAGVTRDRHYGKCEWCGKEFSVVDTGGYTSGSDDVFEEEIRKQVVIAIEEADLILFMTEAAAGITDYDAEIAALLRKCGKPVVTAVNKVDSGEKMFDVYQFYSMGLGEIWAISAANGGGTGDLLDEIVKKLPEARRPRTSIRACRASPLSASLMSENRPSPMLSSARNGISSPMSQEPQGIQYHLITISSGTSSCSSTRPESGRRTRYRRISNSIP